MKKLTALIMAVALSLSLVACGGGPDKQPAIDAMNMSVVLGTLAGDDTVFIVMRDSNSAAAFCGEIRNLLS